MLLTEKDKNGVNRSVVFYPEDRTCFSHDFASDGFSFAVIEPRPQKPIIKMFARTVRQYKIQINTNTNIYGCPGGLS